MDQVRSIGGKVVSNQVNEKVTNPSDQVVETKGSIKKDWTFEVGGNKNSKEPLLAAMPVTKFNSTVIFKDWEEVLDCAVKSVAITAGAKIRKAVAEGKPLPYPTNRRFIMNAKAETELSPQEKAEKAWQQLEDAGVLANLPESMVKELIKKLTDRLE